MLLTADQIVSSIENNIDIVRTYSDYIKYDPEINRLLYETDFSVMDANTFESVQDMDKCLEKYFSGEKYYSGSAFFGKGSNPYFHKMNPAATSMNEFMNQYSADEKYIDGLGWYCRTNSYNITKYGQNLILFKFTLNDFSYKSTGKYLALCYLAMDENFFKNTFSSHSSNDSIGITVYDATGRVIVKNESGLKNLYTYGKDFNNFFLKNTNGFTEYNVDGVKSIIAYKTSPSGWRIVLSTPKKTYFNNIYGIQKLMILLSVVFLLIMCILIIYIIKKLYSPINNYILQMKQIGRGDFNISVNSDEQYIETKILSEGLLSMTEKIKTLIKTLSDEEKKRHDNQIMLLRYQINPHFIYNTLGAIKMMAISHRQPEISDMITVLSHMLRNTISNGTKHIPLKNELKNIKDYVYLQNILYVNLLVVEYNITEDALNITIPCMIIQPIVENAIKHGLNKRMCDEKKSGHIIISAYIENKKLHISVRDDGEGISKEMISRIFADADNNADKHIGIANVKNRILQEFGKDGDLYIESVQYEFTEIHMIIPIKEQENEND